MAVESALRYDRFVAEAGGLADSHRWLMSRVPLGARALDCGCAGGYLADALARERGCVVDGVEWDADAAARAAARCRAVFVGSLEDPGFLDSIGRLYDRILLGDVLEHLVRPDRTLRALRDRLAPGGRIVVSVPNVANWRLRLRLLRGRFDYEDAGLLDRTHLRFYTLETARKLIEGAGYRITASSYTYGPPAFAGWPLVCRLLSRFPNLGAYQTLWEAEA